MVVGVDVFLGLNYHFLEKTIQHVRHMIRPLESNNTRTPIEETLKAANDMCPINLREKKNAVGTWWN
jgi:hypothetical protein